MMEPEDDIKKFEEELKKPKTSGIKKDRIITCPSCGRKQTTPQVALGEEVKCRKCGASFNLERGMSEDAHLVTMAAVDLQVQQMELMERVGRVAPPPRKKVTVASQPLSKSFVGPAVLTLILYLVLWPIGFIANIAYLVKAQSYSSIVGRSVGGASLLKLWFVLLGILPLLGLIAIVVLSIMGIVDLQPYIDKIRGAASG